MGLQIVLSVYQMWFYPKNQPPTANSTLETIKPPIKDVQAETQKLILASALRFDFLGQSDWVNNPDSQKNRRKGGITQVGASNK